MSILTKGRLYQTNDNIGGVKEIYIFYYNASKIIESNNIIYDIQDKHFGQVILQKYIIENCKYTETKDDDFYNQTLTFLLKKLDATTNNNIKKLTNKNLRIVVQFNNGESVLIGKNNGCSIESQSIISNTEYNYNITISGKEKNSHPYINGSTYDDPFISLITQPIILFESGYNIDGNNIITFISSGATTYNTIKLLEKDLYMSDNNFYLDEGFLYISECPDNYNDFYLNDQNLIYNE